MEELKELVKPYHFHFDFLHPENSALRLPWEGQEKPKVAKDPLAGRGEKGVSKPQGLARGFLLDSGSTKEAPAGSSPAPAAASKVKKVAARHGTCNSLEKELMVNLLVFAFEEAIRVLHEEDDRSGRTVEFGDAFHIVENRVQGIGSGDDGAPGVEEHGQVWKATKRSAWPIQQRSWSCLLCINGHGVARDDAQAVVWMRPAAEQLEAMQKLGCRGRGGLLQSGTNLLNLWMSQGCL
ncbi:unnamed protein product [Durusdinium trenchii]|uniref:Uncharacterized protein n=2 Tax=Durusdinium trenchii TaxID=1381693 RepID=A0ABP0KIF8_9DINO